MARTEVPVTTLKGSRDGIAPTAEVPADPAASPNGNVISSYSDTMWLEITCTVAGPVNIVFNTPGTVGGRAIEDDTYAISGAGTKRRFGPFNRVVYGPNLEFNAPASITVAAYQTVLE